MCTLPKTIMNVFLWMSHVLIVDEDDIGDNDNNDGDDDA